jgi:hypothetical protein
MVRNSSSLIPSTPSRCEKVEALLKGAWQRQRRNSFDAASDFSGDKGALFPHRSAVRSASVVALYQAAFWKPDVDTGMNGLTQ